MAVGCVSANPQHLEAKRPLFLKRENEVKSGPGDGPEGRRQFELNRGHGKLKPKIRRKCAVSIGRDQFIDFHNFYPEGILIMTIMFN